MSLHRGTDLPVSRSRLAAVLQPYPLRRQLEEADCGPACLEMLSAFHGGRHELSALKELAHVQTTGTSMVDLFTTAERVGFKARGFHVEDFSDLDDEEGRAMLPAIIHWEENHFVVLYKLTPKEAIIGDPALGLRRIPRARLGDHWNGVLLSLEPTEALYRPVEKPGAPSEAPRGGSLKRFGRGLLRYRLLLFQVLLTTVLLQGLALAQPFLIQGLVDKAVGGRDVTLLTAVGVGLGVLLVAQVLVTVARGAGLFLLSSGYAVLLLAQFWKRLLSLPVSFFARRHRGDLLQRIEDHQRIRRILQGASVSVLLDLVMLVGYGVVLFLYDATVFGIFLAGAAVYTVWTLLLMPRRTVLDQQRFRAAADASRLEMQMLGGIQTLKACGAERQARARWEKLQAREVEAGRDIWLHDTLHNSGAMFVNQAVYVGILVYEAHLVLSGQLTLGQMVATLSILGLVLAPMQNLVMFIHQVQDVFISLRRVDIVYDAEPELRDDAVPTTGALTRAPEIQLEGVTFRYGSPNEPAVLEDVSFTLPAGKMTAIVGRSGAGKTTLTQVLYGLYRPQQGRVRYDGLPIESFDPMALRRSVAFVFQKTDIFDGTLAENIALGDDAPDMDRVLYAARTACLDELLAMPNGLKTKIGEAGVRLSGGEEQRLQLARAIYRDPRVLFLDEATSHLDAELERAITEALQREAAGRTLVVVAHRLSTVRRADKIVVLDKGRVVEEGTHEELVAIPGGRYRSLVENQMEQR
ncbi:peptidase domain-containing ABC transporter [Pyxidicoccus fallax]|uniref:Peptidase domain-containing ABC transporter n=1 Tax=Pyxidicoccus fallax TaxID=394095 RepID=A0A848LKU1_9BACT|nr:peptidase domain-containing ABC transporter [Pyxidicoccus fallax]NMO18348.1 peptidase domain-containing ABC transporter [Pyxidicoccus fallax]NPC83265.1 peptidase domain-containing ABC transporter [Pyxidicoccus fallax]